MYELRAIDHDDEICCQEFPRYMGRSHHQGAGIDSGFRVARFLACRVPWCMELRYSRYGMQAARSNCMVVWTISSRKTCPVQDGVLSNLFPRDRRVMDALSTKRIWASWDAVDAPRPTSASRRPAVDYQQMAGLSQGGPKGVNSQLLVSL